MNAQAVRPLPQASDLPRLASVYVWEWPVRATHWLNVGALLVLSLTGIYMGRPMLAVPGPAGQSFVMGWAKLLHYYAAIALSLSVLSRIAWMFVGNKYARWDKFLPIHKPRREGLAPTLKYYLFRLRKPPGFVGHNPLAGVFYTVVFLAFLTQIATGLALYASSAALSSPVKGFASLLPLFGGLQTARFIHHVVMWFLWAFGVHHVYSAIMMSQVEANATVESIFSGYKFVPQEDLVYSGYRFIDRGTEQGG